MQFLYRLAAVAATLPLLSYPVSASAQSTQPQPPQLISQFNGVASCQQSVRDRLRSQYGNGVYLTFQGSAVQLQGPAGRQIVRGNASVAGDRGNAEITYVCSTNPRNAAVESTNYRISSGSLGGGGNPAPPDETLTRFDTRTFSVRVYRDPNGRTLMNVYDKRAGRSLIQGGPARAASGRNGTEYTACSTGSSNCDGTEFTVTVEASGRQSITIQQGATVTTEVTTRP